MNKRDETIELLAKGLNYNLRYDTLADNEIEISRECLNTTIKYGEHWSSCTYCYGSHEQTKTVTRQEFIDKYRHEGWEVK